jgi:hypothetical protein
VTQESFSQSTESAQRLARGPLVTCGEFEARARACANALTLCSLSSHCAVHCVSLTANSTPDANRTSESSLKRIRRPLECGHASMHVCLSVRLSLGFIWSAIGREPTKTKARACRPYKASLMLIGINWPAPLPHKPIVVIPGQAAPKPTRSGRATRHTRVGPNASSPIVLLSSRQRASGPRGDK